MSDAGVLAVDKTAGVTSFDAVALVRRRLGLKRVGHAGTLDPDATGVLPILLGEATKLMPYLADQDKAYVATLRLGVVTDTGDLSGRVLSTSAVGSVDRAQIEAAARGFVGRIKQVPPMYSAIHHQGQRLYELARQGIEVPREPREVVIHALDVEDVTGASVRLSIVCGKGTYIRALAGDLGAALGCGAAVERLVRTRVGPFTLEAATSWEVLSTAPAPALWARVQPAAATLAGWPSIRLDSRATERFEHGQPVEVAPAGAADGTLDPRARGRRPDARSRGGRRSAGDRPGRCGSFMQIVRGLESFPPDARPSVVALGTFDGVHLGHRAILGTAVTHAREAGLQALACTFEQHPIEILQPARAPRSITTRRGAPGADRRDRRRRRRRPELHPGARRRRAGGLREGSAPRAPPGATDRRRVQSSIRAGGPRRCRAPARAGEPARVPGARRATPHGRGRAGLVERGPDRPAAG